MATNIVEARFHPRAEASGFSSSPYW